MQLPLNQIVMNFMIFENHHVLLIVIDNNQSKSGDSIFLISSNRQSNICYVFVLMGRLAKQFRRIFQGDFFSLISIRTAISFSRSFWILRSVFIYFNFLIFFLGGCLWQVLMSPDKWLCCFVVAFPKEKSADLKLGQIRWTVAGFIREWIDSSFRSSGFTLMETRLDSFFLFLNLF